MEVEMVCKECGKAFMVSAHMFEEYEEDGTLDYCPECTDFMNKEAPLPKRCWEYKCTGLLYEIGEGKSGALKPAYFQVVQDLNERGNEGWELMFERDGVFYFKREYFKEA